MTMICHGFYAALVFMFVNDDIGPRSPHIMAPINQDFIDIGGVVVHCFCDLVWNVRNFLKS